MIDGMPCPFYEDYTRNCAVKFKAIIHFVTFDVCQADDEYNDCVIYQAILEEKPICPVMDVCTKDMRKLSMKIVLKLMKNKNILKILDLDAYCFSYIFENCIRYKAIQNCEKVPTNLRPDGSKSDLKEMILQTFG